MLDKFEAHGKRDRVGTNLAYLLQDGHDEAEVADMKNGQGESDVPKVAEALCLVLVAGFTLLVLARNALMKLSSEQLASPKMKWEQNVPGEGRAGHVGKVRDLSRYRKEGY